MPKSLITLALIVSLCATFVGCSSPTTEVTFATPSDYVAPAQVTTPEAIALKPTVLLAKIKAIQTVGSSLDRDDAQVCQQQRTEIRPKLGEISSAIEQARWGAGITELKVAYTQLGNCLDCGKSGIESCNEVKRLLIASELEINGKVDPNKGELPECVSSKCDCSDFKNKSEAQRVLFAFPDDPFKLDPDVDGVACE